MLPPVRVIVARGEEDVAIKFEDEGGGIARSRLADAWTYKGHWAEGAEDDGFSAPSGLAAGAAESGALGALLGVPAAEPTVGAAAAPPAMHGLGLPLSRLYAKYFGGTLHLTPMEGYGTDCYVQLNRLGDHNCENLSHSVRQSPGEADSRARDDGAGALGAGGALGGGGEGAPPYGAASRAAGSSLFDAQARRR
jgi:pyruvate dehydrogenase kinase 2/3/4